LIATCRTRASDNAIGYLGKFSNFTVGATYSFGRDASAAGGPAATNCGGEGAGNAKACRQVTSLLAYDSKSYGLASAYDILYGGTGAANGLTNSSFTDERVTLDGYVIFDQTKVGFGVIERKTHAAIDTKSDLFFLGFSYPFADNLVLDSQFSRLNVKGENNDSTLLVIRATYNLSKRSALYTSLGKIRNAGLAAVAVDAGGTVGVGMSQTGFMTGIRHSF